MAEFPLVTGPKPLLRPLGISRGGMSAQRQRMEVIMRNIANAEVTRTADGTPYRRQVAMVGRGTDGSPEVRVAEDAAPFRPVYMPGHPDADENGWVQMPNIDIPTEVVDLMIARRVFEANASAFDAAKSMLRRALEI